MSQKILIVDDEESIRYTFGQFLTEEDYRVEMAESLEQATTLLASNEFDAVFLDIMLGRDSGIDVLKVAKGTNPNCPVIMVTGGPDINTAAEAVRFGAFDYLTKPVYQEELLLHAKRATDYKTSLDQNERYQKRMAAVFEGIQDGIMVFDSTYRLIDMNQAAVQFFGCCKNSVGMTLAEITEGSDNTILKVLRESIEERVEGELYRVELEDPQGKTRFLGASLTPLTTSTGMQNDFVLTLRDETLPVREISAT